MTKPVLEKQRYRNGQEITAAILRSISEKPQSKTRIMYTCFLSYAQLQRYLDEILEKQLIEAVHGDDSIAYRLTAKGRNLLKLFDEEQLIIGESGKS